MRAPSGFFWFGLTALLLSGCTSPTIATKTQAVTPLAATEASQLHYTKSLQWSIPGDTSNLVTGIVSAPTPAGPWTRECRFPAQPTNVWRFNCDQPAQFFKAFTDYAP